MADQESGLPPSKKRAAGGELSKDNVDLDDNTPEQEMGTFQRASEEVLAARRIVKVRRHQPQSAPSSNPFAGLRFDSLPDSVAKTTTSTAQPQRAGDIDHDKTDEDQEIDSGTLVNEPNGEEEGNKHLQDVTDVSAAENKKNFKSDAVELAPQPPGAVEEVVNGGEKTHREAGDETCKEDSEEPEKEARVEVDRLVKEEADKKAGEEAEKEARESTEKAVTEVTEKKKSSYDQEDLAGPAAPFSSFQQLSSSQNAFAGLAKTGFSNSSFSFGSISKEGSAFSASCGPGFGLKSENTSRHTFGIGSSDNASSFGSSSPDTTKTTTKTNVGGLTSMQEVPVETGEENEKVVFSADAILYEYLDGGWKERGKGELKVNASTSGVEKARLIMRARGNYRLILNASLYPDMLLTDMEKRGVTFACVNSAGEGKGGFATFALKFKDSCTVEEFCGAVTAYKGKKTTLLKTPENSPKASDE